MIPEDSRRRYPGVDAADRDGGILASRDAGLPLVAGGTPIGQLVHG